MSSETTNSGGSSINFGSLIRRPEAGTLLGTIVVYIFFASMGGEIFMGAPGWSSFLNMAAEVGIIALPVGLLMIAGELDLSVGSVLPAASLTTALISGHCDLPTWMGIFGGLSVGLLVGLVNGLLVTRTTIPSLIITLGTLVAMQGVVLSASKVLTGAASVSLDAPEWSKFIFGRLVAASHQIIIVWWIIFAVVFWFFVHKSPFGNWLFAMGGDKESARNAGIPVRKMTIGLFIMSATAATFVGMCQAILFNSAQVSGGMNIIFNVIFNVIVSVVVGGTLITGGFGSVVGIFFGTLTFGVVSQGIYFTDIDRNWSSLIIGIMLLAAVGMNEIFRKKALSAVSKKKA
ncbi:ABC transporter permease [Marivivens donghaensis]|uniref:Xylose transport system permease protein XylH n=1 Tax=Marivivens donghaensis TaxID=1699413 RepID=A0ABX0W4B1_9RHOB|nr:ABC transporter permease [Marivivens donghaensis]NIY73752.1 ABC transporter permease [Marivivens donghaensis]